MVCRPRLPGPGSAPLRPDRAWARLARGPVAVSESTHDTEPLGAAPLSPAIGLRPRVRGEPGLGAAFLPTREDEQMRGRNSADGGLSPPRCRSGPPGSGRSAATGRLGCVATRHASRPVNRLGPFPPPSAGPPRGRGADRGGGAGAAGVGGVGGRAPGTCGLRPRFWPRAVSLLGPCNVQEPSYKSGITLCGSGRAWPPNGSHPRSDSPCRICRPPHPAWLPTADPSRICRATRTSCSLGPVNTSSLTDNAGPSCPCVGRSRDAARAACSTARWSCGGLSCPWQPSCVPLQTPRSRVPRYGMCCLQTQRGPLSNGASC